MKIEIIDTHIKAVQLTVDGSQQYAAQPCHDKQNCMCWDLNITDAEISIDFEPTTIDKPLLRIDGFLIDYWTAKICHRPGHLNFCYKENFFDFYHENNLQDRLNSLGENPSDLTVDRVVGRNLHAQLVDELLKTINEKSITN